jgi:hypothetical protein
MTERAQLLKSPRLAAEQERMRLIGERLGLNLIAERFKGVGAPPSPQEPTPHRRKRERGGGRKPKFTAQQQKWLQKQYRRDLKVDPRLKKHDGAVAHVKDLARNKYDIVAERDTLLDQIIRPVLLAYFSMEK